MNASADQIRLFVGTSASGEDLEAECVLAYSAHKHCSLPLSITFMRQAAKGPWSGWRSSSRGRTPFTSMRWSIPAVCNYEGKGLYTDVDFFFTQDLAQLWNQPIPNVALVRSNTGKLATACILFDCAKAKGHVPDLDTLRKMPDAHETMLHYFRERKHLLDKFSGNWDSVDSMNAETCAVHYSRIETQLHLKHALPRLKAEGRSHWYTGEVRQHGNQALQDHFDGLLQEAIANGYTLDRFRVKPFDGATRRDFAYKHHLGTAVA